jgi:hypothetical protein
MVRLLILKSIRYLNKIYLRIHVAPILSFSEAALGGAVGIKRLVESAFLV